MSVGGDKDSGFVEEMRRVSLGNIVAVKTKILDNERFLKCNN